MSQPHLKVRMKSWERVLKTKWKRFYSFLSRPKAKETIPIIQSRSGLQKKNHFCMKFTPSTPCTSITKKKEMLEKFIRNIRLISTMHAFRTYFTKLLSNIYVLQKLIGILIRIRIFHDQVHSAESSDNNQMRVMSINLLDWFVQL